MNAFKTCTNIHLLLIQINVEEVFNTLNDVRIFFVKVAKNCDFSRHFQFYCNIVQNACEISLEKFIRLYN